ncbi:uncharacterized protein LOC129686696 [Psammomys obesus]|uniref:uncharacterized protein LOC129686696 n=1 Tax=Psammomys obesus TaxID=48139 RepID=UPI002452BBD7|nr:uncharacterized protein LOC129686696 [Psammomys obesus]
MAGQWRPPWTPKARSQRGLWGAFPAVRAWGPGRWSGSVGCRASRREPGGAGPGAGPPEERPRSNRRGSEGFWALWKLGCAVWTCFCVRCGMWECFPRGEQPWRKGPVRPAESCLVGCGLCELLWERRPWSRQRKAPGACPLLWWSSAVWSAAASAKSLRCCWRGLPLWFLSLAGLLTTEFGGHALVCPASKMETLSSRLDPRLLGTDAPSRWGAPTPGLDFEFSQAWTSSSPRPGPRVPPGLDLEFPQAWTSSPPPQAWTSSPPRPGP